MNSLWQDIGYGLRMLEVACATIHTQAIPPQRNNSSAFDVPQTTRNHAMGQVCGVELG
jgi:hypothetical protein